jgi:hypothetical protein
VVSGALTAGVVLAIVLLRGNSGHTGTLTRTSAPLRSSLTPPSVVSPGFDGLALAAHNKDVLVGLGAQPGGPLDVVVIPSDDTEVSPADVRVEWQRRVVSGSAASSCGSGCLRFPLHVLAGTPSALLVTVGRPGRATVGVHVRFPARIPPRADVLFKTARARMLRLPALGMDETLGSGLSKPVVSRWWFQAPDRMRYSIAGGAKAVVVGTRRWDAFGGRWERSSTPRLRLPTFPWVRARSARLLGSTRLGGRRVRVLAALLPQAGPQEAPAWFLLYVARDGLVLRSRMFTTAHFMTDTYRDFGSAAPVRPPRDG